MEPPEAVEVLESAELVVERRLESETPFSSDGHAGADEIEVPALAAVPVHLEVWRIAWPSVLTFALMTFSGRPLLSIGRLDSGTKGVSLTRERPLRNRSSLTI